MCVQSGCAVFIYLLFLILYSGLFFYFFFIIYWYFFCWLLCIWIQFVWGYHSNFYFIFINLNKKNLAKQVIEGLFICFHFKHSLFIIRISWIRTPVYSERKKNKKKVNIKLTHARTFFCLSDKKGNNNRECLVRIKLTSNNFKEKQLFAKKVTIAMSLLANYFAKHFFLHNLSFFVTAHWLLCG